MTSSQQISEPTPTAATAHGANGLEAYSFDNSGDRHVATEKNGAGSLQLAQAAPSMAITSVTSRQRTSRQRAMIWLFPFKRLVNKTTSPYVSWNNKDLSRLSGWLKLLSLLALVLMSAPTVASAHCEHDDEPATGWGYVAQNRTKSGAWRPNFPNTIVSSRLPTAFPAARATAHAVVVRAWCIAVRPAARSLPSTVTTLRRC